MAYKGEINSALLCPHCQIRGKVRTMQVKVKQGISGGKATGAILTAGLSLFVTGLSKKKMQTQLHCDNCEMEWTV